MLTFARTEYVYLAGSIAGKTWREANQWRNEFSQSQPAHIHCLSPTRFKNFHGDYIIDLKPYDCHPLATDKGLTRRDLFDVQRSSAVVANFLGSETVSIGTCIEIGAKSMFANKLLIQVIEPGNCHDHPMIREIADYTVSTLEEAADLLVALL